MGKVLLGVHCLTSAAGIMHSQKSGWLQAAFNRLLA